MLKEALKIANKAHKGQVRKHSGLPYILHPLEVAKQLTVWGVKHDDIIAAAILHDAIEDSKEVMKPIVSAKIFQLSKKVHGFVDELTYEASLWNKNDYLNSFKDKDETFVESLVIKLADRYCNIKDFELAGDSYSAKYTMKALPLWEAFCQRRNEIASCHYFGDKVADAIGNSYFECFKGY